MNEEKRERRRRDKERMKARARRIYGKYFSLDLGHSAEEKERIDRKNERLADHIKTCSCSGCGNPRRDKWNKSDRLTLQEKRFLADDGE